MLLLLLVVIEGNKGIARQCPAIIDQLYELYFSYIGQLQKNNSLRWSIIAGIAGKELSDVLYPKNERHFAFDNKELSKAYHYYPISDDGRG